MFRRRYRPPGAAGSAAIDVIYVLRGRILPVYLLDAELELGVIGDWIAEAKLQDFGGQTS